MPKRRGNNPKRRISPPGKVDQNVLDRLLGKACYTGSPHHKRVPDGYGFHPPVNPRPNKSLCDGSGPSPTKEEATSLFRQGIRRGMISAVNDDGFPKYVWAVDSAGRAYEAKLERGSPRYHGYELGKDDDAMRQWVLEEWRSRCLAT